MYNVQFSSTTSSQLSCICQQQADIDYVFDEKTLIETYFSFDQYLYIHYELYKTFIVTVLAHCPESCFLPL